MQRGGPFNREPMRCPERAPLGQIRQTGPLLQHVGPRLTATRPSRCTGPQSGAQRQRARPRTAPHGPRAAHGQHLTGASGETQITPVASDPKRWRAGVRVGVGRSSQCFLSRGGAQTGPHTAGKPLPGTDRDMHNAHLHNPLCPNVLATFVCDSQTPGKMFPSTGEQTNYGKSMQGNATRQ